VNHKLSPENAAEFIVRAWISEYTPQAIMIYLVCLGAPVTTEQVFRFIRAYVDLKDETRTLGKGKE
jgi:hypothetical protein